MESPAGGEGGGEVTGQAGEGGSEADKKGSSSSMMLGLLEEFTRIYCERLQRVDDGCVKADNNNSLQEKVGVLESWIRDLGEQNAVLVSTVEELEREAGQRVTLLEDRLAKMATTTRQSCVSLRDHQIQVSALVADKVRLEGEARQLEERVGVLEGRSRQLQEENAGLHGDLDNLVQVISEARQTGRWETNDFTFSFVTPEQVFGPVLSSSRPSSQCLKEGQQECLGQSAEEGRHTSLASSLSNLQDADGSSYSGRDTEKDLVILKLRTDLQNLQSAHDSATRELCERDRQITELQTQLVELDTTVASLNAASHTQRCHTTTSRMEPTRKEEVIRHILSSKQLRRDSTKECSSSAAEVGDAVLEVQLNANIDVLLARFTELEEECRELREQHRALQDTHALCAPTITMLQEQLTRSQKTQEELRSVLTAEVAQRHDQLTVLRDELKEQWDNNHEAQMQIQLKNEVIKELRKELKDLQETCGSQSSEQGHGRRKTVGDISVHKTSDGSESANKLSQVTKLENELAEKSILLQELQSHLAASRQELHLKDETLYKLEQKLDACRREGGEKGERMQYLTGQLTSLQLEVGRTHGQAGQLRTEVGKKAELLQKMEKENLSLTQQLNEKSSTLERFQNEIVQISAELEKKRKEIGEQRLTIGALQEALVSSKRNCDQLRCRLDSDVSAATLHTSLPHHDINSSSNSRVTKSIPTDSLCPHQPASAPLPDTTSLPTQPDSTCSADSNTGNCSSHHRTATSLPSPSHPDAAVEVCEPDLSASLSRASQDLTAHASCANTPDVLSSCTASSYVSNSAIQQPRNDIASVSGENGGVEGVGGPCPGQVHDV